MASPIVRGVIVAALLAVAVVLFLYLRSTGSDDGEPTLFGAPSPSISATPEPGTGPLDDHPPIVGRPAPDFALRSTDGGIVKLSDLRGKVVWVNFWATWCRPCKKELPSIQKLSDEHRDDLVVLAVNWQDGSTAARSYFEENGLTMRVLLDRGGVYDQYRLQGLPDSFFIDRDGTLAVLQYGELTESKMRERLAQAGLP